MNTPVIATAAILLVGLACPAHTSPVRSFPGPSTHYLKQTPPSTNAWWMADDSMKHINVYIEQKKDMPPGLILELMRWDLLSEPCHVLAWIDEKPLKFAHQMLEALYRSGDDPIITNALHMALLAPTNNYREASFRACVMASPVPMTRLAETVVENIPPATRERWYRAAAAAAWTPPPSFWSGLFHAKPEPPHPLPTRESLRLAHFLFTAKAIETDPACLEAIGDPANPKAESIRHAACPL